MVVHDVVSIELLAREIDLVKEVLGELFARTVAEVALRAPRKSVHHGGGVHGIYMVHAWRVPACTWSCKASTTRASTCGK